MSLGHSEFKENAPKANKWHLDAQNLSQMMTSMELYIISAWSISSTNIYIYNFLSNYLNKYVDAILFTHKPFECYYFQLVIYFSHSNYKPVILLNKFIANRIQTMKDRIHE